MHMLPTIVHHTGKVLVADWVGHWYYHNYLPPVISSYTISFLSVMTLSDVHCKFSRDFQVFDLLQFRNLKFRLSSLFLPNTDIVC